MRSVLFLSLFYLLIVFTANGERRKVDSLYHVIYTTNSDTVKINAYLSLGYQIKADSIDKSLEYADKCISMSKLTSFDVGLAKALLLKADLYKIKEIHDTAIAYYDSSITLFKTLLKSGLLMKYCKLNISSALRSMGNSYYYLGIYEDAVKLILESMEISEQLDDKKQIAASLLTIGAIHNIQKNWNESIKVFTKALEISRSMNDKKNEGTALNNLGATYGNVKDYVKAEEYFLQALAISKESGNAKNEASCYNNLGLICRHQGNYQKSLEYLEKTLEIRKKRGNKFDIGGTYVSIGYTYNAMGNYHKGVELLEKGMEFGRQLNAPKLQIEASEALSDCYYKLGKYKEAYEYLLLYKNLSDSLVNTENDREIARLQFQHEFNKKQKIMEMEQARKDEAAKAMLTQQKILRNSFIGLFVMAMIVAFFVYRNYRTKKKANELLEIQKKNILEMNEELRQQKEEIASQAELLTATNKELEKHQLHLELLVKERTAELEIAKDKAEESDRLKSAFLANMSHEVRTPMNAIIGFSSLLDDDELTEKEKKEYIRHIIINSNSLLHLIEDIVNVSIIESGELNIFKQNININKLFDDLIQVYALKIESIKEKEIEINHNITEINKPFLLFTDGTRLQQILTNLIENAIKFTEKGTIKIGYEQVVNQNKKYIRFFVSDTGIGMTEKQKGILFKRFSKADESKEKLYRGAGLGLNLCKNLVELLGGKIWAESEFNHGSTFFFELPFEISDTDYAPGMNLKDMQQNMADGKTILIAEDEESNFKLLEAILSKTNTKILHANNGQEAIEMVKNNHIDLILMDIKMPVMNGLEATKIIKSMGLNIPIIAQTAFAFETDEKTSYNSGCDAYISKPILHPKLMDLLAQFLK